MRRAFWILILCVVPLILRSQGVGPTSVPDAGGGSIAGQVLSDRANPQPIRRALVTLRGGSTGDRKVITNDEGRFAFADLPVGRFTLTAEKAAYVGTAYGASQPCGAGSAIVIARGAHVDVTIRLPYGAILEGTIRNRAGEPLSTLDVRALRVRGPELKWAANVETDDRGVYRIFGLPAGDYVLSADMALGGTLAGDTTRPTSAEIDATLATLTGRARAAAPGLSRPAGSGPIGPQAPVIFAPQYFPGVVFAEDAARVSVNTGDERTGLDFAFDPVATVIITGSIVGPVQDVSATQILLQPAGLVRTGNPRSARAAADGTFVFRNVPPGHYSLMARANRSLTAPVPPTTAPTVSMAAAQARTTIDDDLLYATADVETRGGDAGGFVLTLQPGGILSGRLTFDGIKPMAQERVTQIQISLTPATASVAPVVRSDSFTLIRQAKIHPDGTFTVVGIAPGAYKLGVTLPPDMSRSGWRTRSALFEDHDLLDTDAEFALAQNMDKVIVTISDRQTALSGVLKTAIGEAPPDYIILAFSTDPRSWRATAHRTQVVRPSADGTFQMPGLPPGDYFVTALTSINADDLMTPAFFEQIAGGATRVAIGDGEQKVVTLQVVR